MSGWPQFRSLCVKAVWADAVHGIQDILTILWESPKDGGQHNEPSLLTVRLPGQGVPTGSFR